MPRSSPSPEPPPLSPKEKEAWARYYSWEQIARIRRQSGLFWRWSTIIIVSLIAGAGWALVGGKVAHANWRDPKMPLLVAGITACVLALLRWCVLRKLGRLAARTGGRVLSNLEVGEARYMAISLVPTNDGLCPSVDEVKRHLGPEVISQYQSKVGTLARIGTFLALLGMLSGALQTIPGWYIPGISPSQPASDRKSTSPKKKAQQSSPFVQLPEGNTPLTTSQDSTKLEMEKPVESVAEQAPPTVIASPLAAMPKPISTEDKVRELVLSRIAAEDRGDLDALIPGYAPRVQYYENASSTPEDIRKEKHTYFQRWPERQQKVPGSIIIRAQEGNAWEASYTTEFRHEDGFGRITEGEATNILTFVLDEQGPLVSRELGETRTQRNSLRQNGQILAVEKALQQFVIQHHDREMARNPAVMADYADKVDYYSKPKASRDEIAAMKAKDAAEWPIQRAHIDGPVEVTRIKGWTYRAEFPLNFKAEKREGAWQSGLVKCTMEFAFERGVPRIRRETNERLRFERGGPQGMVHAPPLAAQPNALPAPQAKGRVFNGKGRVYKVPELAGLVGKPLKDAWLWGDFILRSTDGNTGHFNTMTRVLLVKEGSTRVDIEFEGGIELSQAAISTMQDPMLVLPIRISAETPMELLRVYRDGDGEVHVKARHSLPLRK